MKRISILTILMIYSCLACREKNNQNQIFFIQELQDSLEVICNNFPEDYYLNITLNRSEEDDTIIELESINSIYAENRHLKCLGANYFNHVPVLLYSQSNCPIPPEVNQSFFSMQVLDTINNELDKIGDICLTRFNLLFEYSLKNRSFIQREKVDSIKKYPYVFYLDDDAIIIDLDLE